MVDELVYEVRSETNVPISPITTVNTTKEAEKTKINSSGIYWVKTLPECKKEL